jgi:hypothetical protein
MSPFAVYSIRSWLPDKSFCPARAASLHIEYPMLFKVQNRSNAKFTHCGVLEFSADEGMVYMPYWVRRSANPALSLALHAGHFLCLTLLLMCGLVG